ncbi:MAG: VCBS repeat-containing protein [Planctomycetaceae bacterium]|nr:VCBS repeat-containing protein [Planctomycetaceae bacterium]
MAIVLIGLVLLVFVIGTWWLLGRSGNPRPNAGQFASLSMDLQQQTETEKNLGVGLLENGQFADAEKQFAAIAKLLPEEPLGWRNLTIARLLMHESGQMDIAVVQQAQKQLLSTDEKSAVTHVLAGRIAGLMGDADAAVAAFERATGLAPQDAAIAWELFQATRSASEALKQQGLLALDRASQLQPQNLFLLTEQLLVQAESQDDRLQSTLKNASTTLGWLTESVQMQNQIELPALLDQASAAASQQDWKAVMSRVRILSNVLRPQPATQSDRMRIQKHPMEFILRDFSAGDTSDADVLLTVDPVGDAGDSPDSSVTDVSFQLSKVTTPDHSFNGIVAGELADMDLDARSEIIVAHRQGVTVLKQDDTTSDWVPLLEFATSSAPSGLVLADLDLDLVERPPVADPLRNEVGLDPVCHEADIDMIVYGEQGVVVLKNHVVSDGSGRELQAVSQDAAFAELRGVTQVITSDLDHDGNLDLAVASDTGLSLWSGRGDLTYIEITGNSQLPPPEIRVTALRALDIDRDLDTDVLVAAANQSAGYLENVGHGRFRWLSIPVDDQISVKATGISAMGTNPLRSWDLLYSGPQGTFLVPTVSSQSGMVQLGKAARISNFAADGLMTWDYDNDGWVDIVTWTNDSLRIFRRHDENHFRDVSGLIDELDVPHPMRSCRTADIDQDGDSDVLLTSTQGVWLLKNQGGNRNAWLNISLRAEQEKGGQVSASGRVNHYGIGSILELRAGQKYQAQIVDSSVTHFGLGKQPADIVRVLWTNGVPANIIHPKSEQQICERQTLKGSCPYLYAWNGKQFEFVTDLLWSAPMGLQFAEGVYAPARNWEYLRIDGTRMQPEQGCYRLQVTEELWEAAYFDQVQLLAVDHPEEAEIYSNEKVGPAEIAEFRIHSVRNPLLPITAVDQRGRDVLAAVRQRDGIYLKAFDRKFRQGLTEEHFLELTPDLPANAGRIMLFLTGWIYPTDTSLNVALGKSRDLSGPRPPSLWIQNAAGEWREAMPFMGFPGGKTKTIAIDLTDVFKAGDKRLQIRTTAEICWDDAFFAVDELQGEFVVTPLDLTAADLHYRGFSRIVPDPGYGPESLDYMHVDHAAAHWPPMTGRFTRYGDVSELVQAEDDLLVVMGSGDELTLEFAVPTTPLRPGWKRDFLIHNIGWDKDADLNTIYGQSVEPLPFGSMSGYPYRWDEAYPETILHTDYLQRYQTRRQFSGPFRRF